MLAFFSQTLVAEAVDCPACLKLLADFDTVSAEKKAAQEMLAKNEAALSQLSPDDISKKVKIASNIFMFKTKIETKTNNGTVLEKQINEMRCTTCPRPQETK